MQAQLISLRKLEIANTEEKYKRKEKYYSLITMLTFFDAVSH